MNGRNDRASIGRRLRTIPLLFTVAFATTVTLPLWLPLVVVADLIRLQRRLPLARLGAFGVCWAWIEVAGVVSAFGSWLRGRALDPHSQYALMRWWSAALMKALELTIGIRPKLEGAEALSSGNVVMLSRHASLADSLLSAWAACVRSELQPRYVLKKELLYDPCLDIVGSRVPNHFLDRAGGESELDELRALSSGMTELDVAMIFPEGTRSSDSKRSRALVRIAESDAERAERMSELSHLLPPRPTGSGALIDGAPTADIVLAWHTGFDGLDTFRGMIAKLAKPLPTVRFVMRRVSRACVPEPSTDPLGFAAWLDEQWLRMDAEVGDALATA